MVRPRSYDPYVIGETLSEVVYKPKINTGFLEVVVDLGAYIGDFSLYAAKYLGSKKIYGLEMDEENYSLYKQNIHLNELNRIILPIKAAICDEDEKLGITKNKLNFGMHKISKNGECTVSGITLKTLIEKNKIKMIDLLKMDIEGAENLVLTDQNKPIFKEKVRGVIMETHPFAMSNDNILKYFNDIGFVVRFEKQFLRRGSIIEAFNPNLRPRE